MKRNKLFSKAVLLVLNGKKTTAKKYAATEKKLTEGLTYEDISDLNWISL